MNNRFLAIPILLLTLIFFVSCSDSGTDYNDSSDKNTIETNPGISLDNTNKNKQIKDSQKNKSEVSNQELKQFTLEEIKSFDGENGNRVYVAIDGLVYDVTEVDGWSNGMHKGNKAGVDLSNEILKSPHKKKVLEKLTLVGKIKE